MALTGALLARLRAGSANYPYVTARVRAKKTKLVPRDEYTKLLAMDVSGIARHLEEGEYKKEILQLASQFSGALLVETATRLNLSNTYRDVLHMAKGELRLMLLTYLQRYDVYNVKTVLRGRFSDVSEEEIARNLIPAGALSVEDLEGLARLGSVAEVMEALKRTPYGAALKDVPATPERLTEVENALDRMYYATLLASVPANTAATRGFRNFLEEEIDAVNVKTLLRLRVAGVDDAGDLFLPGGRELGVDTLRRLLRAPATEVAAAIDETRLSPAMDGIRRALDAGDLNPAVTALDRFLVDLARPFSQRYPLSVLPVIDFVLRKRREVDNLRIIAYGKATGIKEETLEDLVIV